MTGHVRTWNLIKDYQLDALETIYGKDLDFYISIWKTTTASKDDILNYYKEKNVNLINLNVVERIYEMKKWPFPSYNNNFLSNSSLQYVFSNYIKELSTLDKKQHEFINGIIYDRVVFIRPDMLLYFDINGNSIAEENNFVDCFGYKKLDFALQLRGEFMETVYPISSPIGYESMFVAGFLSSDIFGMLAIDLLADTDNTTKKLKIRNGEDCHSLQSIYIKKHLITVDNRAFRGVLLNFIRPQIVRPTMNIEKISKLYKNWKYTDHFSIGHCELWGSKNILPPDDAYKIKIKNQIQSCIINKIDLKDYDLHYETVNI